VGVFFVKEATCDGLSEGEMMLLSKFEHAAHCFLSFRLASCGWRCLDGRFSEGKEVRLQRHAAGMSARKETRFDLGPQVKGDGHGNLSFKFTPAKSLSLMTWVPDLLLFLLQAYLEDGWTWMHDNTSLAVGLGDTTVLGEDSLVFAGL